MADLTPLDVEAVRGFVESAAGDKRVRRLRDRNVDLACRLIGERNERLTLQRRYNRLLKLTWFLGGAVLGYAILTVMVFFG